MFCHLLPLPSRQAVHGTEDLRTVYVEGKKREKFYPGASPSLTTVLFDSNKIPGASSPAVGFLETAALYVTYQSPQEPTLEGRTPV